MRTGTLSLLLLLLGPVTGVSIGEHDNRATADEKIVRSLDDQARAAFMNRDLGALDRLWSDEFFVNTPSNRVLIGKAAVLAAVGGVAKNSLYERQIEFVRVDGDIAIIMGGETVQPIGGAPVQRRFTNIWKKSAGTWRLFARHANVVPGR